MTTARTTARRRWSIVAGVVALALVVVGVVLVVNGGEDGATPAATTTTARPGAATAVTLPLGDTSQAALERLTGLVLPAGTADFLTARLADDTQLDVTFTIPAGAEATFVSASGLPAPKVGDRVVNHSSPLWKLNPEGKIAGTRDTHATVVRAVELVPEGGRVRARVVLTPAG